MKNLLNKILKEYLPEHRKNEIIKNLKRNCFFSISAMAFFCLSATLNWEYIIGLVLAFVTILVISSQIYSVIDYTKKNSNMLKIISLITAGGICYGSHESFYDCWSNSTKFKAITEMLNTSIDICRIISVFGAIISLFFVYFCVLVFFKKLVEIFRETKTFHGIKKIEWVLYGFIVIVLILGMILSFNQTDAFYGTEFLYDIIYTSDSSFLMKGNVYVSLTHEENDIRQPLFAVFSAPFIGGPFLISKLICANSSMQAMFVNSIQIVMLIVANIMLAQIMKLDSLKRICFIFLTTCTYTQLLFTLMMEQYIIAYFWLIFCMYFVLEKKQPNRMALWGACGTLLTSTILLIFMPDKSPIKNFKAWFKDILKYGFEFLAFLLVCCRFDVIFNLATKISSFRKFSGLTLTLKDKFFQYTEFVHNCFLAPSAGVNNTFVEHISWQLETVTSANLIGIIILRFS